MTAQNPVSFWKAHAYGNDFLYARAADADERAARSCGAGARGCARATPGSAPTG